MILCDDKNPNHTSLAPSSVCSWPAGCPGRRSGKWMNNKHGRTVGKDETRRSLTPASIFNTSHEPITQHQREQIIKNEDAAVNVQLYTRSVTEIGSLWGQRSHHYLSFQTKDRMVKSAAVVSNLVIALQHQHHRVRPLFSRWALTEILLPLRGRPSHTFADRAQTKHSKPTA